MLRSALIVFGLSVSLYGQTREERWQQDLQFLQREILTHPNPFTKITRAEFEGAFRDLTASIAQRTDIAVLAEAQRIVASVGDSHTSLYLTSANNRTVPIRFRWFSDGLFVTQAAEAYSAGIGKKVVRIGTKSAEEAYLAVRNYISYENDNWARLNSSDYLIRPDILAVAGVIAQSGSVPVTLEDGKGGTIEYVLPIAGFALLPGPQLARPKNPLYLRNAQQYYWFDYLPESKTVYIKYNKCTSSPALPMEDFAREVVAFVTSNPVDRFVLDLRNNSGGNASVIDPLFVGLLEAAQSGKFFPLSGYYGIIGRETFSSGTLNAIDVKLGSGMLVGESTGGGASVFGEVRNFTLPNLGAGGQVSTKKFENANFPGLTVEPDVAVDLTAADYFADRDPVLEKILTMSFTPRPPSMAESPR